MADKWVRMNEAEDVVGSIRHVKRMANFTGEDGHAWKWLALALHSALQGACVCHLTTSATPVGAVTPRNASEWLSYFVDSRIDPDAKQPRTFLMGLPDLLKAVRKPNSADDHANPIGIAISSSELDWLRRFHDEVRNQFVRFEPMSWSLEVSGIPELAKLIARIIRDILGVGYAFRHLDCSDREELSANLESLISNKWLN